MITDAILGLFWIVMEFFVTLLPTSDGLPSQFETSLQNLFDVVWGFNEILPVDTLFAVLGIVVAFEAGVYIYRFVRWLLASTPLSPIKHK